MYSRQSQEEGRAMKGNERKRSRQERERPFVLVAGGTGGHVFPAISVAVLLQKLGRRVIFITDERAQTWVKGVDRCLVFPLRDQGRPTPRWKFFLRLIKSGLKSLILFLRERPAMVVGFGGYPSAPPVLAAQLLRIPTLLHECNSLLGRANAILKPFAKGLTSGFPHVLTSSGEEVQGFSFVGNPLRRNLDLLSTRPYTPPHDKVRLFVTGGSQGADFFTKLVPAAIHFLPGEIREKIEVTQQVREKDVEKVKKAYEEMGVPCEIRPFFEDMETPLRKAHLMIARSGALTLSEIAAAGVPSVLVPLASSRDGDQLYNALQFHRAGAAHFFEEKTATPGAIAKILGEAVKYPQGLKSRSQAARTFYVPLAAEHFVAAMMACLERLREEKLAKLEKRRRGT